MRNVPAPRLVAPTFELVHHTLDNGLRVVLAPDRAAPVVGVSVLYDVGFRSEPEGRTGFAHLFEHLMFQGSATLEKLEHARLVNSSGGTFNGSTHPDYTDYFEVLPANALERGLFLEADRMTSPRLTAENLANQLDVVKKPCVFFNQDGFYDDLLRFFDKMLAEKFFKPSNMDLFRVATTVPDIFTQIEAARHVAAESKWFQTR